MRLREQWFLASVYGALHAEDYRMTAFVNALKSLLSLYGFGPRASLRRRPGPVYIGRSGTRRLA